MSSELFAGKMALAEAIICALALIAAAQLPCGLSSPATAPAFLWSSHYHGSSEDAVKEVVDYRTISTKELATTVLSDGGWSNLVCSEESRVQDVDIALVFIGRKLRSSDISRSQHADPSLLDMLKDSFTSSNFSMAFPYVALSDEKEPLENSLVLEFVNNCGHGVRMDRIATLDSCSVNNENVKKLDGLHSLMDFMSSKIKRGISEQTDLIVVCSDNSEEPDHAQTEGEILSDLVKFLEQSDAKYTVLYASEPYKPLQYTSNLAMSRFLAESTSGNASLNSTLCDGVCQFKSSLVEGILVAIVLLIILISGLCCMMGIDTPTRFETPQE